METASVPNGPRLATCKRSFLIWVGAFAYALESEWFRGSQATKRSEPKSQQARQVPLEPKA
jgi:hypothetical protein